MGTRLTIVIAVASLLVLPTCSDGVGPAGAGEIVFMGYDGVQWDMYSVSFRGRRVTVPINLTSTPGNEEVAAWSPDGSKIAFGADRDRGPEVYVMNWDGSGVQQLTDTFFASRCPTWSSDGSKIAYLHNISLFAIFTMNPDGSSKVQVSSASSVMGCPLDWSPDDSTFAWSAMGGDAWEEVYVINADGTGLTNVSANPDQADDSPAWSPDGSQIAFFSSRGGVGGIYTMNPDGTGVQPLIVAPGANASPSWSPDGRRLVFTSNRDGPSDIYIANLDGTGVLRLTNDTLFKRHPRWRPSP